MIRGVIFDMDGVLCDSEPFIAEAAIRMFAERHRVAVQAHDFLPFVGTGEDRFLGGVAEKYAVKLSMPSDKDRTYEIYLQIIKGRLAPLPGAVAFIADCRRRGLKLALATSADRVKMVGNLEQIGIPLATFDAHVSGNHVTHKKPDPEIFLLAAQRMGLEARDCLVVEDAVNGVKAAKSAGSACLALTTSFTAAALKAAGANYLAPNLADVPAEIW